MLIVYSLSVLLAGVLFTGFGVLVFYKKGKKLANKLFGILTLSYAVWSFAWFIMLLAKNPQTALFLAKLLNFGATLIPLFYFHWILVLLGLQKKRRIVISIGYIITLVFLFISFSKFYISGTHSIYFIPYWPTPGLLYKWFIYIVYIGMFGYALCELLRVLKRASGFLRSQLIYIIFGSLLGSIGGGINFLVMYKINIFSPALLFLESLLLILSTAIFTYVVVKHRLMDVRLIILRTITYSLVVGLISATVVGLTLLLPQAFDINTSTRTIIAIFVSIFIVLILDPLKKLIARVTDKLFFKASVDYQKLLGELSEVINREIDLDILLYSLARRMEHRLKVKNVSLYLSGVAGGAFYKRKGRLDKEGKKIKDEDYDKTSESQKRDLENRIPHKNPLISFLHQEHEVIVMEGLERKIEDTQDDKERKKLEESKQSLDKMDAAVVAPIMVGNHLNAVMVLGPKLSGDPYGSEDLELLGLIGPQLASALEKARLYDEAKQFTERLKKEIAIATEDLRSSNLQLQERNKFLLALQNVTNLITKTLDFRKVTQNIADSINSELGYLGGILLFLGKNKHKLFPDAVTHSDKTKDAIKLLPKPIEEYYSDYAKDNSRSIKAIKNGKVQIGTDLSEFISPPVPAEISKKIQKKLGVNTIIAVPVYSELGIIGVIDYLLADDPGNLKETDLSMMKSLANQTGIIYRNIELYRQLQETNNELEEANKHLQQLDQAKSEFVSIASHQLRTPMTGIMGYLSMMLQGDFGKVPKEQQKVQEDLLEESQRMIRLINLFLNVSKIESGRLELSLRPMQVNEVIEKVMSMTQKHAEEKKLKLTYKPTKKLPDIMADKDKLGDIVMNLVDNAIKYTDKGSVEVQAKLDKKFVQITVTDTGRGIPPGEAEKLFTKFVRGYGIAQVNPDGSGLGLYVARRLTEAHHGKIWVDSKGQGKGSMFHVTIPVAKSEKK